GLLGLSKHRLFSDELWNAVRHHSPIDDLDVDLESLRRWHPLKRSIYFGGRLMLPGLLLNAKGDRVAMHSSVEVRYPFLDEDFFGDGVGRRRFHAALASYLYRFLPRRP